MFRTAARLSAARTVTQPAKPIGDISSVFPSLSGAAPTPLPTRFADLKGNIISGRESAVEASYRRLLTALAARRTEIQQKGPSIIPTIDFTSLESLPSSTIASIRRAGAVVIRNVLPPTLATSLLEAAKQHISSNTPHIRAFPPDAPSVYELYWTPSQRRARAHENILETQRWLLSLWDSAPGAVSPRPLTYADRLRIRPPGDANFALGPHIDGGSVERWEDETYCRCYEKVFAGDWEGHDSYDATHRVEAKTDLYNSPGGCGVFRMWQGWLSLSATAPGEGGLRVLPALKEAMAYTLLRPFFDENHNLIAQPTPQLHGASLGGSQELLPALHPELEGMMTGIPAVGPGDYVAWHCDAVHAVDPVHRGKGDSSVLYIPAVPLTKGNVKYLAQQREAARGWGVPPDFPGAGVEGVGEAGLQGMEGMGDGWELGREGRRAMGLDWWDVPKGYEKEEEGKLVKWANRELGF